MAALKRAFADVILNTAKESAVRILASERRVLQLQQSLSLAREESLDMLLRLKSIMDSKVMALSPISHSSTSVQFSLWQKIAFRGDFSSRYPVCTLICLLSQDELLKFDSKQSHFIFFIPSKRKTLSGSLSYISFGHSFGDQNNQFILMLHSKLLLALINESEKSNLSQVRKIKKLEVQLGEAKGTINFLRSELKRLNSELDQRMDIQAEFPDGKSTGHNATSEKYNCKENIHNSDSHLYSKRGAKSVPNSDCCFTKRVTQDEPLNNLIAVDNYAGNPDLASIILSNKEPELYRNGCTQRIRAFERNQNETNMCENKNAERPWAIDFGMAEKIVRRKMRRQKRMRPAKCITYHDMQHYGLLGSNHSKVGENDKDRSAGNSQRASGEAPLKTLDSCSPQMSGENQETTKDQKTKLNKFSNHRISGLLDGNRIMTRRSVLKLCNTCEDHTGGSHTSGSGATFQENSLKESLVLGTSEVIDDAVSDAVKNGTLLHEIILSKADDKLAEDLGTSITKGGHDDCKDEPCKPCGPAAEDRSDKILKYTFQRKRKRVSIDSKVDSTSLEGSMSKQTLEKDNAVLDPQKSSLLAESSRESRRLAQVARQVSEVTSSLFHKCSTNRSAKLKQCKLDARREQWLSQGARPIRLPLGIR
ncbi:unnamed protein product [Musa acuminata subsp. burmannicoides]